MDYSTFNGRENRSNHAGTDHFSRNSQACGSFHARSAARLENCDTQSPHAEGAAGNPLCPSFMFLMLQTRRLEPRFFSPRFLHRKKSSSSGIILSKACRKTHAVPSRRQKKLPRTAGAGASEFLVVKRQGARCLAQNNYKLHALLHFINLS